MGRKKKTKTVEVVESQPISYSGKVIIKKIKKGKVVSTQVSHNEGTTELFKFLLNCLAGNWLPDSRPSWITTAQRDNSTSTDSPSTKYVSNNITSISQPPVVYELKTGPYIEYKFLIPFKPEYSNRGFNCLVLYNNDNKPSSFNDGDDVANGYSMTVMLDNQQLASDEQMLIIWQLEIKN